MTDVSDPHVLYLVARESLGMSPGKLAAQVGHGVDAVHTGISFLMVKQTPLDEVERATERNYDAWGTDGLRRMIVLSADEKEWAKVKALPGALLVVDAGFTELSPNTETVVAFFPMRKSERPGLLKRLRLLA